MTTKIIELIEGTFTMDDGQTRPVELEVTAVELRSDHGIDSRAISSVRLVSAHIPDGEYVLDYFYFEPLSKRVRVRYGMLMLV
jgi:hypothetical protein